MDNTCLHNEGWYPKTIMKPYYNETQLVCSKCHRVIQVSKDNNLISSWIGTQDPTKPIQIGEDMYELSSRAKKILNRYEKKFGLINQVAEKLPEGQNDPTILALFHCLLDETHEELNIEDCYYPIETENHKLIK